MKTVVMWKNSYGVLSKKQLTTKLYSKYYCNEVKMHGEELEKNTQ